jgi:hypothetical protein
MASSGDIQAKLDDFQAKLDDFQAKLDEIKGNLLKLALVALNDTQFSRYSYITKKVCPENGVTKIGNEIRRKWVTRTLNPKCAKP